MHRMVRAAAFCLVVLGLCDAFAPPVCRLRHKGSAVAPAARAVSPPGRHAVVARYNRNPLPSGGPRLPNLTGVAFFVLLLAFPGFFFNLINGVILAVFVVPALLSFAFQFWAERNVISSPCPSCGTPATGIKGSDGAQCFSCGADLVFTNEGDKFRLRSRFEAPRQGPGAASDAGATIDVENLSK